MVKRIRFWAWMSVILAAVVLAGGGCGGSGTDTQAASDYSNPANWMDVPAENLYGADTFYLYPTAVTNPDKPLIVLIDDAELRAGAQALYRRHKPIFSVSTNVYAPYYPQLNLGRATPDTDMDAILFERTRRETYAALDYYFEHYNSGRPFILAGHSQGSAMLRIVLKDYMKTRPEIYKRMVAAYIVGYSITSDDLTECPYLKFAESADDTGVVVSWNTEGPANAGRANMVVLEGGISINPLTWTREETYATASLNRGSALRWDEAAEKYRITDNPPEKDPLIPGLADARVNRERGVVICSSDVLPFISDSNAALEAVFGPQSYHGGDYAFYFDSVRENVRNRVNIYLKK
ncbi:MAG: DUF3089 domain-containing protein [Fretibacterium sp.]|nr:DUF3089 domain-containing protein [Fretibacterium sp.]